MVETTTAPAAAAPATSGNGTASKRVQLPKIERVFETKAKVDAEVEKARGLGYKDYALRKFEVKIGNKTMFIVAYNEGDAYGRLCESGAVHNCSCVEFDAAPKAKRVPSVDGVLAAVSGFSEADRERIKKALAAKK